jgi:hypothetical protein
MKFLPGTMSRQEKILAAIGLAVFVAIVVVVFRAYLGPEMLIDFVIRLCS